MPPTAATLRVGRYFLALLVILVALFGLVFLPGQRHTPKLGLDLEGGAQVILKAKTDTGKLPSASSMKIAIEILRQRVNGAGVSAAEVVQEGSDRIVISVPGKNAADLAEIGKAAVLNFRPLVMPGVAGAATVVPTAGTSGTATASPSGSPTATKTAASTAPATGSPSGSAGNIVAPRNLLQAAPTTTSAPKTSASKTPAPKTPAPKTPAPPTA